MAFYCSLAPFLCVCVCTREYEWLEFSAVFSCSVGNCGRERGREQFIKFLTYFLHTLHLQVKKRSSEGNNDEKRRKLTFADDVKRYTHIQYIHVFLCHAVL